MTLANRLHNDAMTATNAKNAPRFVPTLTEVVAQSTVPAVETNTRQGKKDFAARMQKHLNDDLGANLDGVISKLVEEHVRSIKLGIQIEIEQAVRRAFDKANQPAGTADK
jgi:Lhr-like helicase